MKSYIGYSTNSDIRYKATSGGIGTTIINGYSTTNLLAHPYLSSLTLLH